MAKPQEKRFVIGRDGKRTDAFVTDLDDGYFIADVIETNHVMLMSKYEHIAFLNRTNKLFQINSSDTRHVALLNNAKALFARAGVVIPDVRGAFAPDLRKHSSNFVRVHFFIPTPNGSPVRVDCYPLVFDLDGRIDYTLVETCDVNASTPNEMEKALLPAGRAGNLPLHKVPKQDIVTLYKLRGGDPESRFTQHFLSLLGA